MPSVLFPDRRTKVLAVVMCVLGLVLVAEVTWAHANAIPQDCPTPDTATLPQATTVTGDPSTPGDTATGPGVILAFEHAHHIRRSAQAVRALTTPDAALPPVESMQRGIDHTPADTSYRAHITPETTAPAGPDRVWLVDLIVISPEHDPYVLTQKVTTTERDGRTLITAVTTR